MNYFRMWLITLLLVLVGLLTESRAHEAEADFAFTPRLQKAYFEIQKLRLNHARELLEQERAQNPANGALVYLENYADMYYLLISEDMKAYATLSKQQDARLSTLARLPGSSPYQRLLMAEVRLHWAFAKLKFGSEVSACWDIIKAYRLLEENRKKFPAFAPTLKSLGLLHVLIGSIPDNYAWVAKMLGLKGSISQGLNELQQVQRQEPFFRQEAQLIELLLHAYTLQMSPAQIQQLHQLPRSQPDNLLLHFFGTSILMKEGRSEEALTVLAKAPRGEDYLPFPFLDYLRAEILLQKGQYATAFAYYSLFQKNFKGFNFLKDSYFKQFLCRWLDKSTPAEALVHLARVEKVGSTITESDQYAQRFAEQYRKGPRPEQKVLFRARYASDGGYLAEAWEALEPYTEASFQELTDRAEFNYRRGRILQKKGQPEQATRYYQRTIALCQGTSLYYGASSALQLGYICREKQQNDQAVAYFRKAMSFKKHEYKNSIDNKARAALTELGV
ncbi:hypothetical protein GCM10027275_10790 [Rhabdobacter roseus]|uniref:Tetratricopeptide repeat protein n=1 Tax=Rhabdobacter roseus TaxID=1655419 RepID=A0A840TSM8_9BACT|nr:tetratricopeptide repeat protein [Rhabdobacter roseus]MBB5282988.1 hypothetical protein [Rhabdobacter roseus]